MFNRIKSIWLGPGHSISHKTQSQILSDIQSRLTAYERDTHTLVIPTFNRVDDLKRLINYLEKVEIQSNVMIFDSSSDDNKNINLEAVYSSSLNIEHHSFSVDIHPYEKMHVGLQKVQTKYISACADDDLIILPGLRESIKKLNEANENSIACHGLYFNFAFTNQRIDIRYIEQAHSHVVGASQIERLNNFMHSYQVLFYSVQRTSVAKLCFAHSERFSTTLLKELHSSVSQILQGEVHRVTTPYLARNTAPSLNYSGWHPHQLLADKPEKLFQDYLIFRDTLLGQMERGLAKNEFKSEIIDMIFLKYLGAFISEPVMQFILKERLEGKKSAKEATKSLWDHFVVDQRAMHKRVPLYDKETKIFNPGNRRTGTAPLDFCHIALFQDVTHEFLIFHEFLYSLDDSGLKINKKDMDLILDSLALYYLDNINK